MKTYLARAWCDWGNIYENERIQASSFQVAFRRAAILAKTRARRRPREISINVKQLQ